MIPTISFTPDKLRKFKRKLAWAKQQPDLEVFMFEDHEVLVQYAEYVVQYLEQHYHKQKP